MAKDDWYFAIGLVLAIIALFGIDWKLAFGNIQMLGKAVLRARLLVIVVLLSLCFSSYGWYDAHYTLKFPIADTPNGERWAYTPLKTVYRKNFHDEQVVLDGNDFVDCTFGNNVTLKYTGFTPFRMEQSQGDPSHTRFLTDNLVLGNALRQLSDLGFIKTGNLLPPVVLEKP
jgi:hypothetical protein